MGLLHELNKVGHKLFGGGPGHNSKGTSFYIGTDGIYLDNMAEAVMNSKLNQQIKDENRQIYDDFYQANTTQNYNPKPKPESGYSRNVAATAKDIAQGGMTKDEVIEFNMRHPNETAKRSE